MYNILKLNNFRRFKDFSIEFKPISLIAGKNNTGKTSILESVFLLHDYMDSNVFLKLLGIRGIRVTNMAPQNIWEPLFYEIDSGKILKIEMDDKFSLSLEKNNRYTLPKDIPNDLKNIIGVPSLNYALSCTAEKEEETVKADYVISDKISFIGHSDNGPPFVNPFIQYIGPHIVLDDINVAQWFGILEKNNKKGKLIEALKILDETIMDITTIVENGLPLLYITNNQNSKMPVNYMGDGIRKIMSVALTILANPSCVLLLDEIENGLHYSLHERFWELTASLATQEKCQVIATTHSYECINGAFEGVQKAGLQDNFAYIRLDMEEDNVVTKTFTSDMLEFALASNLEVR
ncbi:MAG: ATP-binding protein [Oscillospiraceae bacterium]|nr:ATP-binding protein [Oscillospiraceae bacterium]